MRKRIVKRFIFGLCTAMIFIAATAAVSAAGSPEVSGPVRTDCDECHGSVVENWEKSAHGQALINSEFQDAWQGNGADPECLRCHTTGFDAESGTWRVDGVGCMSCHEGQTGPHPETAMPTDSSSRNCSSCHIETHEQWQASAHGEGELSCVRCHNPHTTGLRASNMQDLCSNCHGEESYFFNSTAHAEQDLSCTDCHLRVSETPLGEGHGRREHTFAVDLETCNQCHAEEMHLIDTTTVEEIAGVTIINTPADSAESCADPALTVSSEPEHAPASPANYLFVAVVGLTFGVVVSPVAENWYGRFQRKDESAGDAS